MIDVTLFNGEKLLKSKELGSVMMRYCLAFETIKNSMRIPDNPTLIELIDNIANAEELSEINLRTSEKKLLNAINQSPKMVSPIKDKIKTRTEKISTLIKASLGSIDIPFALKMDLIAVYLFYETDYRFEKLLKELY
jgi:hypothetical protein